MKEEVIKYCPMLERDAVEIEEMIKGVFDFYVAPDYAIEGVQAFYDYIKPEPLVQRVFHNQHQIFLAKSGNQIVGVIELRDSSHISLLFVKKAYQRLGIAKQLIQMTLIQMTFVNPNQEITVNASPYAAMIYEKLGFKKIAGELVKNGITYIPMIKEKK